VRLFCSPSSGRSLEEKQTELKANIGLNAS
jgi:hypothetical protein